MHNPALQPGSTGPDDAYVDPVSPATLRRAANLICTSAIPLDIMPECSVPLDPNAIALATADVAMGTNSDPRQARALTLRVIAMNMATYTDQTLRALLDESDNSTLPGSISEAIYLAAAQAPLRNPDPGIACFASGDILPILRRRLH